MIQRRRRDTRRPLAARLDCSTLLTYDASSLVPGVGEIVPCPRHDFCAVAAHEQVERRRPHRAPLPPRRTTSDLADFLGRRHVTTVRVLRANRFTLRIVVAAQKEGLVDVDLLSGRVALRPDATGPLPH